MRIRGLRHALAAVAAGALIAGGLAASAPSFALAQQAAPAQKPPFAHIGSDVPHDESVVFGVLPNGTSTYAITLDHNPQREEVVSVQCGGVVQTLPITQCINQPMYVSLRPRLSTGMTSTFTFTDGQAYRPLGQYLPNQYPRLVFAEDPTKYRGGIYFGSSSAIPAGSYTLERGNRDTNCRPVLANTSEVFEFQPGQQAVVTWAYRMTDCTITVEVSSGQFGPEAWEVVGGNFTCVKTFSSISECMAVVSYGSTVSLSAEVPDGYVNEFRNNVRCLGLNCTFVVNGDEHIKMSIYPAADQPPPIPVTLSIAGGGNNPANSTLEKGAADQALLQFVATPAGGTDRINSITLATSGTGRDDMDLVNLRLVLDADGDGELDGGEQVLATGFFAADNDSLTLTLATLLVISEATTLLVVADVAGTVHTASLVIGIVGGTGLLLATMLPLVAVGVGGARRRRWLQLGLAAVLVVVLLSSCGGDDTTEEPPPPPPPPPPAAVTYQIRVTGMAVVDNAAPATNVNVSGTPISGGVMSVEP